MPGPKRNGFFRLTDPLKLIWGGFLVTILTGATVLWLLQLAGKPISAIDALFTSTSAVCVTGLIVKSTPNDFHFFSELWLLILIQVGGIGFMSLSIMVITSLGRRASFTTRDATIQTLGAESPKQMRALLMDVIRLTVTCEAIGALVLFVRFLFIPEMSWYRSLWFAVFHSVSAFCNAGFGLWNDSLERFVSDPVVNIVIASQIVIGGIGFLVAHDVFESFRRSRRGESYRLAFHTKLVLATTALLIIIGAAVTLGLEWNNPSTLGGKPVHTRLIAALFQSITTRTAGFNTIPMGKLTGATLFIFVILMFIGASPGSCGGGIKTTTVSVVFLTAVARFRGRGHPTAFNREISDDAVSRALTLTGLVAALLIFSTILLMAGQEWGKPVGESRGFIAYLFETASAMGTVGLSMGISGPNSDLKPFGKILLVALMYMGRVGPLVIFSRMARRPRTERVRYPSETPSIG